MERELEVGELSSPHLDSEAINLNKHLSSLLGLVDAGGNFK